MQLNIQKDRIESLKEHGLVKTEQIKDLSHQLKERNTSAELHASKNLNEPGYIKECKDWEVERLEFENRELKRLNKMSKEEEKALRRDNKALRCDLEGVRSEVQLLRREKLKEKVKRRVDIVGKELEEGSLERQYGLIIEKVDR